MAIVSGTKSVKEAAEEIGVTHRSLRRWINNFYERCPTGKGKPGKNECKAVKVEDEIFAAGFIWQIPAEEVERLKSIDVSGPGRPRIGR